MTTDHALPEPEELLPELHTAAVFLARRGFYDIATLVECTATKLRIMQDDIEDIAASLAEAEEREREIIAIRDRALVMSANQIAFADALMAERDKEARELREERDDLADLLYDAERELETSARDRREGRV